MSNSILSLRLTGFGPGRSTLDQISFVSQFISDGFNKSKPGARTILATIYATTIDFSKALESVWYPAIFYKLTIRLLLSPVLSDYNGSSDTHFFC